MRLRPTVAHLGIALLVLGLPACLSQERSREEGGTATLAAADLGQLVEGIHQMLTGLAQTSEMATGDASECNEVAAKIVEQDDAVATFVGRVQSNGTVDCGSTPPEGRVDSSDRLWFERALSTKEFSVGEYQVGRVTKQKTIVFAQPVLDDDEVSSVLIGSVDLETLDRRVAQLPLPQDGSLTVLDGAGTVLARPDGAGRFTGKKHEPFTELLEGEGEEDDDAATVEDLDGVERRFETAVVEGLPKDQPLYVLVGVAD